MGMLALVSDKRLAVAAPGYCGAAWPAVGMQCAVLSYPLRTQHTGALLWGLAPVPGLILADCATSSCTPYRYPPHGPMCWDFFSLVFFIGIHTQLACLPGMCLPDVYMQLSVFPCWLPQDVLLWVACIVAARHRKCCPCMYLSTLPPRCSCLWEEGLALHAVEAGPVLYCTRVDADASCTSAACQLACVCVLVVPCCVFRCEQE